MPLLLAFAAFPWRALMNWLFLHAFPSSYHYYIYDDWASGLVWWACVVLPALISMGMCIFRFIRISRVPLTGMQIGELALALLLSLAVAGSALHSIVISPPNPHAPGYWHSVYPGR